MSLDYAAEWVHLSLVGFCIYIPLFSYNKILLKLVIIIIIITILLWDVYGECPIYRNFKQQMTFYKNIYKFVRSPDGRYIPHISMLGLCLVALDKL